MAAQRAESAALAPTSYILLKVSPLPCNHICIHFCILIVFSRYPSRCALFSIRILNWEAVYASTTFRQVC